MQLLCVLLLARARARAPIAVTDDPMADRSRPAALEKMGVQNGVSSHDAEKADGEKALLDRAPEPSQHYAAVTSAADSSREEARAKSRPQPWHTMSAARNLVRVTVSENQSDTLVASLSCSRAYVNRTIVITSPHDAMTQRVCAENRAMTSNTTGGFQLTCSSGCHCSPIRTYWQKLHHPFPVVTGQENCDRRGPNCDSLKVTSDTAFNVLREKDVHVCPPAGGKRVALYV